MKLNNFFLEHISLSFEFAALHLLFYHFLPHSLKTRLLCWDWDDEEDLRLSVAVGEVCLSFLPALSSPSSIFPIIY